MTISKVHNMVKSLQSNWKGFFLNPNYYRSKFSVSWPGHELIKFYDPVQVSDIQILLKKRQYSFMVALDGAIIQLYYHFENSGRKLAKATLSYYGRDVYEIDPADEFREDLIQSESIIELQQVPWLRFDYSPTEYNGVLHSECHLHIGGFPNSRLPVNGIPTPEQFIELIISQFYPDVYRNMRLNGEGLFNDPKKMKALNRECLRIKDRKIFPLSIHLSIPK